MRTSLALHARLTHIVKQSRYSLPQQWLRALLPCRQATPTDRLMMNELSTSEELKRVVNGFLKGDSLQYRAVQHRVRQYICNRYSAPSADRDDLVSEILETLLVNLRENRFRGSNLETFNGYVFGIARLKFRRALHRDRRNPGRSADHEAIDHLAKETRGIQREVADSDLVAKIYSALDPRCRELLRLKFAQRWSDQEIADHEGKTKNAISTAISRCVGKARKLDVVEEIAYQKSAKGHLGL